MAEQLALGVVRWEPRSAFVRSETIRLGAFLAGDEGLLVGWRREYRCECGFRCTAPGDIWDHTLTCVAPSPENEGGSRKETA